MSTSWSVRRRRRSVGFTTHSPGSDSSKSSAIAPFARGPPSADLGVLAVDLAPGSRRSRTDCRGVVLRPDASTSERVRRLCDDLADQGIRSHATWTHRLYQPHTSLIVADDLLVEPTLAAVVSVPRRPLKLQVEAIGIFPLLGSLVLLSSPTPSCRRSSGASTRPRPLSRSTHGCTWRRGGGRHTSRQAGRSARPAWRRPAHRPRGAAVQVELRARRGGGRSDWGALGKRIVTRVSDDALTGVAARSSSSSSRGGCSCGPSRSRSP